MLAVFDEMEAAAICARVTAARCALLMPVVAAAVGHGTDG